MSEKTIFEKIVAGEIPCYKVYEDSDTFAFLDISPNQYGHTLVITKQPFKNIYEIPGEITGKLFQTAQKIAVAVKKATEADGININMNNEPAAGQVVFHVHVHIIPRFENDGGYYGKHLTYPEGKEAEIQNKIIANL
jgi:histidine triad (HIT) family protein